MAVVKIPACFYLWSPYMVAGAQTSTFNAYLFQVLNFMFYVRNYGYYILWHTLNKCLIDEKVFICLTKLYFWCLNRAWRWCAIGNWVATENRRSAGACCLHWGRQEKGWTCGFHVRWRCGSRCVAELYNPVLQSGFVTLAQLLSAAIRVLLPMYMYSNNLHFHAVFDEMERRTWYINLLWIDTLDGWNISCGVPLPRQHYCCWRMQ